MLLLVWLIAELAKATFTKPLLPEHLFVFAFQEEKIQIKLLPTIFFSVAANVTE